MNLFKATCIALLLSVGIANAQTRNTINIYPDSTIKKLSPLMTGACIEDVNHEIYGGIYSQMIFGESFQEIPEHISAAINPQFAGLTGWLSCIAPRTELGAESEIRSWQPVRKGNATGSFNIDSIHSFVGKQSQQIRFISGAGSVGIEDRGLNREGLCLTGQKPYEGILYAKSGKPELLYVTLESEDGSITYAETSIAIINNEWGKYEFKLTPLRSAIHARLSITLKKPGEVVLGYVFMQPGSWGRYKNLPLRKDVVEGLLNEKVTVMRYGGSMTLADNYLWKNMIGPREKRQPYKNIWYPFASNGWGIIDFMNMCEAMGIPGIPDFHSGETPRDMADFVEYENGAANTTWGKKRVADGHPAPYHLKYLELGNEQYNNPELTAKFKLLADAIWSKDPSIQIIFCLSDDTRGDISGDLANIKQTIEHCRESGHQAWFDVHVWNDKENEPDLKDFIFAETQLKTVANVKDFRLCIFEENANNARMKRGLAHANAINRLQRLEDDVPIVCEANCLQVDHQNDNGWDQGLLFFNPEKVWGQSSAYVTKILTENYLTISVKSNFTTTNDTLDITALKSADGKTISLQVVNSKKIPVNTNVILNGYKGQLRKVNITTLKGSTLDDWNTADELFKIVPVKTEISAKNNSCNYTFQPYSITVLRFQTP